MTLHRFPEKKRPPKVHTSDVAYARAGMEQAEHGKANLATDIEHHERILKTVGSGLSEGVRVRLTRELAALHEMHADAEAEAAVWQEVVQALVCLDAVDDRPDPDPAA